jgi:hypothetical protein
MKNWEVSKPNNIKAKITSVMKNDVGKLACNLIGKTLKLKYINPEHNSISFNQLVDIYIKWREVPCISMLNIKALRKMLYHLVLKQNLQG